MKLSDVGLPNVLPPKLAPYAKLIYGAAGAVATALILVGLGKLGIDVSKEILDLGPETEEITWRQAVTGLVPLIFVYLVPNGAEVHHHDESTSPDDDGETTLGTPVAALYEGAGPRGEASQA